MTARKARLGSGARVLSPLKKDHSSFIARRAPSPSAISGRHAALPAPLTRRRRSDARRRHPRLRRRELEAARATARSRLDQVRHRHRAPTSALRTPARRHPSDRHSPRACRAAAGASARAAAAALYTFSLNDEPRGAAERPLAAGAAGAPARRQPRARVSTRRGRRTQRK